GKVGERLRENLDLLPLSKELTTLYLEADVDLTFEDLKPKDREIQRLKEIYTELGFRQLLMELDNGNEGATFAPPPQQGTHQNEALGQEWVKPRKPDFQYYHRITTEKALHELVDRCQMSIASRSIPKPIASIPCRPISSEFRSLWQRGKRSIFPLSMKGSKRN